MSHDLSAALSIPPRSRILICGSRYAKGAQSKKGVEMVIGGTCPEIVICGGCPSGIDKFVVQVCNVFGTPLQVWPAPWTRWGASAGPLRNGWMLKHGKPDYVIAFPGGAGTENMVKQAEDAGVPVVRISEIEA